MATFALREVKDGRDLPHHIGGLARPNRTASTVRRDECGKVRIEQRNPAGQTSGFA